MNLDAGQIERIADSLVDSHAELMDELISMRKRHRLSQSTVAERMGVSQPTVASFERYDANPTLATIRRYALAVGASIEHKVKDECEGEDLETTFAEVVSDSGVVWDSRAALSWEWTRGEYRGQVVYA